MKPAAPGGARTARRAGFCIEKEYIMMVHTLRRRSVLAGLLGGALGVRAQTPGSSSSQGACSEISLGCATSVNPVFDAQRTLWLAWVGQGAVCVARSSDGGASFGAPIVVGRHGTLLDVGSDARPAIAIDARGRIAVAYAIFTAETHQNGHILVSTSSDGGASFSRPRVLSHSALSQRFPVLLPDASGGLFASWIDKRGASREELRDVASAVGYAWSRDGGATFDSDKVVRDRSCDCCAPAAALDAHGRPVLLYRNVAGARLRDHVMVTFADADKPAARRRIAADRWEIDACPHHGPSLAVTADGACHAAWYTEGEARQGLFYARSTDAGRTFSTPRPVGNASRQAGRPFLLARGNEVWLAWKEFDGARVLVKLRQSHDGGRKWSADRLVADSGDAADNPVLVSDGERVHLSWMTRREGYRLIPLEDA
jgi:hypothetical protein